MTSYLQNGDLDTSHTTAENKHLEDRANWAKERLSLQLALNQAESDLDRYKEDLRIERDRRSSAPIMNGHGSEADKDKVGIERDRRSSAPIMNGHGSEADKDKVGIERDRRSSAPIMNGHGSEADKDKVGIDDHRHR